jgi:hypothetical protein
MSVLEPCPGLRSIMQNALYLLESEITNYLLESEITNREIKIRSQLQIDLDTKFDELFPPWSTPQTVDELRRVSAYEGVRLEVRKIFQRNAIILTNDENPCIIDSKVCIDDLLDK